MIKQDLLSHHDYERLDIECCCEICTQWRQKRTEYEELRRFVKHHSRSCFCWKCCNYRELQIEYLAIQNKRDVYCEMSWHMGKHSYGPKFMKWLQQELLDSAQSDGWWAKTSPIFSLDHWVYIYKEHIMATVVAASGLRSINQEPLRKQA